MNESKVYHFKDIDAVVAGDEVPEVVSAPKREPIKRRLWRKREQKDADSHDAP